MSNRSRARLTAAIALSALTTALATAAVASAAEQRGLWDSMALARVAVGQDKLEGRITFSIRQRMPPLKQLKLYPKWINADGKHLCVAIDGGAANRRLLCPGGRVSGGSVYVGVSRYRRNGSAVKLYGFRATFERRSKHSFRLSFPLRRGDLRPGPFRYFAASAWRSPKCAPPARSGPDKRRRAGLPPARPELGQCRDRLPAKGSLKGKIYKVERVGCTTGDRGAFTNGPRSRPRVALTFDDGPSAYTTQILRSLDRLGAKGTFFETGNVAPGNADLMRRIIAHGHEIGNHSYAHEPYPGSDSMRRTNQTIRAATRFEPCLFRPPYGLYGGSTVAAARHNGMSTVLWDIDTNDWRQPGTGAIYASAVSARPGSIVLMHDGGGSRGQTAAAVPDIVRTLRSRGYKLVTVTELMGGHFKLREKR